MIGSALTFVHFHDVVVDDLDRNVKVEMLLPDLLHSGTVLWSHHFEQVGD